ncbi:ThiJ/PfpI family protein [Granulibacter bethesdensis CGDNIH4]|nr:ThiJ/PfpI family protein [Granulibacter bethesdensis CGDNIH4]
MQRSTEPSPRHSEAAIVLTTSITAFVKTVRVSRGDLRLHRQTGVSVMQKRVLHVVTNVGHFNNTGHDPTGLWLSELTDAWHVFGAKGLQQQLVSPKSSPVPLDPRSLRWPLLGASAKAWLADPGHKSLLSTTARPEQIDPQDFAAIYFTGGHGVMWDIPENEGIQAITRAIWENGGLVSAVCHGYCGLLNTRLTDGKLLVAGKKITGFSWTEEIISGLAKKIPYSAEAAMKARGARYEKAVLPFLSHVVADGQLITGQNPFSARATAERVSALLS